MGGASQERRYRAHTGAWRSRTRRTPVLRGSMEGNPPYEYELVRLPVTTVESYDGG